MTPGSTGFRGATRADVRTASSERMTGAGREPSSHGSAPKSAGNRPGAGITVRSVAAGALALGLVAFAVFLGFWTYVPGQDVAGDGITDLGISEFWPVAGVIWCVLTLHWRPRAGIPRNRRVWWWATACFVVFLVVGALASDFDVAALTRMGLLAVAQAVTAGLLYQGVASHGSWAPYSPLHLARLATAVIVVSTGGVLLGAYPGTWPGEATPVTLVWWSLRNFVYMVLVSTIWFMLHHWRRPPATSVRHPWQVLILVPLCAGIPVLVYAFPALPLSWLMLLPMAWAGLALPPRWSAVPTLLIGLGSMAGATIWRSGFPYRESVLPAPIILDLLISAAGALAVLLALFRDARARLRMELADQERAIRSQATLLSAVFHAMSDGVCITDDEGRVGLINRAARTMLGRIPKQQPTSWVDYLNLRTPDGSRPYSEIDSPLRNPPVPGEVAQDEIRIGDNDDAARVLAVTLQAIATQAGTQQLVLLHDVTSQHARQLQLKGFAHTVAHDLKQPLATAVAWIEQVEEELEDGNLEGGIAALERVRTSSRRMASMIDELLAYNVAREGVLREATVPLRPVVEELVSLHSDDLRARARFDIDVTHAVHADPTLVRQLFANLIGNAVKYSRPGEDQQVTIRSASDSEPGYVAVSVADRGVGIQPGDEERIFGMFSRSDKDAGAFEGTGLGLALCRTIVLRHGGEIRAERNGQGGATIRFTLPEAFTKKPSAVPDPEPFRPDGPRGTTGADQPHW